MNGILWSVVTVLSWGTWLLPLHAVREEDERWKTFWITLGILLLAAAVAAVRGFEGLRWNVALPAGVGGVLWAVSGWAAVRAVAEIGLAKAMGIWSPLNVLCSMIWGGLLFQEFAGWNDSSRVWLVGAVLVMLGGILLIVRARSTRQEGMGSLKVGMLCALVAGIGWGSYFVPLRMSGASPWVAAFPLAVGMWVGALLPLWMSRPAVPSSRSLPGLALGSACLWSLGNYGSLFMMEAIGTGRGFTVAQGCVVVNALVGVLVLKDPPLRTRSGLQVLCGVLVAALAAVAIGLIKG